MGIIWTKEKLLNEALKYNTKIDFQKQKKEVKTEKN